MTNRLLLPYQSSSKLPYFYLYKTTFLENNKEYIGVHSTTNLNDNYIGSGAYLLNAIKVHGIEKFKKEIIEFFDSEEAMYKKESEIVTKEYIKNNNTYNIVPGGKGGTRTGKVTGKIIIHHPSNNINIYIFPKELNTYLEQGYIGNPYQSEELKKKKGKGGVSSKGQVYIFFPPDGKAFRINKNELEDYLSKGYKRGQNFSEEQKKKMSANSLKGKDHQDYGKIWVNNPITKERFTIYPEKLDYYLEQGFQKGKYFSKENTPVFDRVIIYNEEINKNKMINKNELDYYLNLGWKVGSIYKNEKHPDYGKIRIYHPETKKNLKINENELDNYLNNGYIKGTYITDENKEKLASGKNKIWITNSIENKRININDFLKYQREGWKLGKCYKNKI